MTDNKPKSTEVITNEALDEEINKLEIEVIPTPKIDNIKSDLKIEMKNIKGIFGIPNILCEYIILSGPSSFDIRIQINKPEANNFYLLYSEDSINFTRHINDSTSLSLKMKINYVHTFVFYAKKSFYSPPFSISSLFCK